MEDIHFWANTRLMGILLNVILLWIDHILQFFLLVHPVFVDGPKIGDGIKSWRDSWSQIKIFIAMISEPLCQFCLVTKHSDMLENAEIIIKLLLDCWEKLQMEDVLMLYLIMTVVWGRMVRKLTSPHKKHQSKNECSLIFHCTWWYLAVSVAFFLFFSFCLFYFL